MRIRKVVDIFVGQYSYITELDAIYFNDVTCDDSRRPALKSWLDIVCLNR